MKNLLFSILAALFLFACGESKGNSPEQPSSSSQNNGNGEIGIGSYAVLPTNVNKEVVRNLYNSYMELHYITYEDDPAKDDYLSQISDKAKGTARIKASYSGGCTNNPAGNCTCSEAIGYGMFLAAAMEDWDKFDRLLAYSKAFRIGSGIALMKWNIENFYKAGSGGSATDADLDILGALFIAYEKTGSQNYLDDIIEIGASIYEWEIDPNNNLIMPAIHNDGLFNNGMVYNISYFSLPVISQLARYDQNRDWNAVLEANLSYMESVQNAGDGLWPDWSDEQGIPKNPQNGSNQSLGSGVAQSYESYFKETPRIPWRIAWYYQWKGDSRAKAMLDKGMNFLRSKGVNTSYDVKSFYSYQGNLEGSTTTDIKMWASLCALGMGSTENQEWLDACNERILSTSIGNNISNYYANSLLLLYAMLLNGML